MMPDSLRLAAVTVVAITTVVAIGTSGGATSDTSGDRGSGTGRCT